MGCFNETKKIIPYGMVLVKCYACEEEYLVKRRDLHKGASENRGWFPCVKGGSHTTTWDIDGGLGRDN